MNAKCVVRLAVLFIVTTPVHVLGVNIVYDEDFETGTPDDVQFNGWSRGRVISDGIDGQSYSNTRVDPREGEWGVVLGEIPGSPPIETGRITFDLYMDVPFTLFVTGNQTHWTRDRGFTHIHFRDDGAIVMGGATVTGAWQKGIPFNVSLDWFTESVDVYLDNIYVGDGSQNDGDFTGFYFRYGAEGVVKPGTITVDNIVVEAYTLAPPPPRLTLYIDATGDAYIRNTTHFALPFSQYEIRSASSALDPDGWRSIEDAVNAGDPALLVNVIGTLGIEGLHFKEWLASSSSLIEGHMTYDTAVLQSGGMWYIGKPTPTASEDDLSFFYDDGWDQEIEGNVVIIPEPATLSLLALGGLALTRHKRNKHALKCEEKEVR